MSAALYALRFTGWWLRRHRGWTGAWLIAGSLASLAGDRGAGLMLLGWGLVPAVLCAVWCVFLPVSYERVCAGPARRVGWWRRCRLGWPRIAEACHLTALEPVTVRRDGKRAGELKAVRPRLWKVRVRGHVVELTIRARAGQTVEDLDEAAPRIAATLGAVAHRTRPVSGAGSGCAAIVELVMADRLTVAATACEPDPVAARDRVRLGRAQGGGDWWLQLRGRHTLVAGCSGAGKGSVLWGVCCGLAPAVRADVVRLWGIDLKRGVELAMGAPLFSAHAYSLGEALDVLRALMRVIDGRGSRMAGTTRLHEPVAGDPLHVLVIDELAALTAYADVSIRREADRLLSEILTQGRALGVVVVACVQDPRKDVVSMRGLFTQTIALRLRSSDETMMVLGDGMSRTAPAHRISHAHPGTGWVVEDTGAVDRVRADFWPDELIRDVATRYASPVRMDTASSADTDDPATPAGPVGPVGMSASRAARKPRQRSPRASSRVASSDAVSSGVGAA